MKRFVHTHLPSSPAVAGLSASPGSSRISRAFTLIELLVVIGIIAALVSLLFPALQAMRERGKMTKEISAAKQIMAAYVSAAGENDGHLLLGYDKNISEVSLPSGTVVSGEMCCRYPWRLAPYLGEQMEEIFLVNDSRQTTSALKRDSFEYRYRASLNPALAINAYCIGGYDDGSGSGYFSTDVVRVMASASKPSSLIVFASGRMKVAGQQDTEVGGNFIVTPPRFWRTAWAAKYDASSPSSSYGNVALRWNGSAVCAFLDGHVALLDEKELRDMRHWSNTAVENDNPSFAVPR